MSFPGLISPQAFGAEITALMPSIISPKRKIGTIVPDITIEEEGRDRVTTTEHPVEQGANITDHAYKNPAELTMYVGFSNSSRAAGGDPNYAKDRYNDLLTLQVGRDPVTIITGKRKYTNMILHEVEIRNDETTEDALMVRILAREIIVVKTTSSPISSQDNQAQPQKTAPVQQQGTVQLSPQGAT